MNNLLIVFTIIGAVADLLYIVKSIPPKWRDRRKPDVENEIDDDQDQLKMREREDVSASSQRMDTIDSMSPHPDANNSIEMSQNNKKDPLK